MFGPRGLRVGLATVGFVRVGLGWARYRSVGQGKARLGLVGLISVRHGHVALAGRDVRAVPPHLRAQAFYGVVALGAVWSTMVR